MKTTSLWLDSSTEPEARAALHCSFSVSILVNSEESEVWWGPSHWSHYCDGSPTDLGRLTTTRGFCQAARPDEPSKFKLEF